MRKFMKIAESVTDDISTNTEIESKLDAIPDKEERTVMLDYLERIFTLKQVTADELRRDIRDLHPSYGFAGDTLKKLFGMFPNLITDDGDELILWRGDAEGPRADPEIDTQSMEARAASQQVEIVFRVVNEMSKLDSFTAQDVRECLYDMGMTEQMANMFADHVMQHFTNNSTRNPDGSLTLHSETSKKAQDYIDNWKKSAE